MECYQDITYELIRSPKRKTVSITITDDGVVQVRVPQRLSKKIITECMEKYASWIRKKTAEKQEKLALSQAFHVWEGDTLPVLGMEYPVKYGLKAHFDGTVFFIPQGPFEEIRPLIIQEYCRLAREILCQRVEIWSEITGLIPESVRVNHAKARWGSCSGSNRINFSWRLLFAPLEVLDYVVVHELCHIQEHNHSARFWTLVGRYLPNYADLRAQLSQISERFCRENWG